MMVLVRPAMEHRIRGTGWMLLGGVVVFGTLLFINDSPRLEKERSPRSVAEFAVKQPEKPRPKKKVVQKPRKQNKAPPPPALAADLNIELSGLDFGFDFGTDGTGESDDSLLGDTGNVVMTSDMVDTPPRVLKRTPLNYPARAKAKDLEGYVVLSLFISASGRVEDARVLESDPPGVFDSAAIRAVKSWVFTPARYDGKAVDSWANQTIRFELG